MFLYVLTKHGLAELFANRQIKGFLFFIFLTAIAGLHGLVGSYAIEPLKQQIGYILLLTVGYYALRTLAAIKIYMWLMVAIHSFAVIQNFSKFDQATRTGGFSGVGYFLGDGNDLGWSLAIAFAFSVFLVAMSKPFLIKIVATVPAMFILVGLLGTKSRGAALALSASMLYYLLFISKRKSIGIIVVLVVGFGAWVLAPEGYFERMETISAYEEDTSATGRLKAWGHAIEMAIDHPILGVGAGSFNSAYGRYYRGEGDPVRWISTHSMYFKVLAEYGFTGIILFISIIIFNFIDNYRSARLLRTNPSSVGVPESLPLILNMALVGYSVAGTFLSGVNYPHIFLITAMTLAVKWQVTKQVQSAQDSPE